MQQGPMKQSPNSIDTMFANGLRSPLHGFKPLTPFLCLNNYVAFLFCFRCFYLCVVLSLLLGFPPSGPSGLMHLLCRTVCCDTFLYARTNSLSLGT